jgi:hypothetical protein
MHCKGDIFDELRRRKTEMMNRHARLMTHMDQLKLEHGQLKFVAEQAIRNAAKVVSHLQSELRNVAVTKDKCEKELQMKGNLMHEVFHKIGL